MLNDNVFYHGTIRKAIVAFGRLFSNVYIERREGDSVTGDVKQKLLVPIAYAPKEKWLVRIEQDPALENNTYVTLPRISFEITGYNYDSNRKLPKMNKLTCNTGDSSASVFTAVPYNVEISLYILTKTQEDALQIVEQILPTFTPEYSLSLNSVPDMNIIQSVPVTLNSVSVQDEYDGDFQQRRFVTHTLTFTLRLNLYGGVQNNKPILSATANVFGTMDPNTNSNVFTATGDQTTYTVADEGWDLNL